MSITEEPDMNGYHHRCNRCHSKWPTASTLNDHMFWCDLRRISKENPIDNYFGNNELPSQKSLAIQLFHLTKKYDELEDKVAKLQKQVIPMRRKQINEYLEELPPPRQAFPEWSQSIQISDEALETLFNHDLKSAIKHVLEDIDDKSPIRAFSQKPNIFYLYDTASEWRQMNPEEFIKFIEKIEFKFTKKFAEWNREHQSETENNEKAQEQTLIYMAKVNGVKQGAPSHRMNDIKRWLYSKMAVSLKQFVV